MPERYRQRILDHLADRRYEPRLVRELARDLQIESEEFDSFRQSVDGLVKGGHVLMANNQTVILPPPGRDMVGQFRLNKRGFGFLIPDSPTEHGDLFVPEGSTMGAMTGDRVRAKVIHDKRRSSRGSAFSPYIGRVIEIVKRADRQYVGNLTQRGGQYHVDVDGQVLTGPIIIRDPHAKNAKVGDKVAVEMIDYPTDDEMAEGVIVEVLGDSGLPDVETRAVMRAYGLADKFPDEVVDAARTAAQSFDDQNIPQDREDLRDTFIVTIDPPDAKDFDDAISIRRIDDGSAARYELGVHIADVANFVTPGGALDVEAQLRGNSTYLPRRVVPMLPEVLSNGVCSLQEAVPRFTKSAFMTYDDNGKVLTERFSRSVIHSAKRMTYLEAQALIDDDIREARKHARTEPKYPKHLVDTVKLMDELARVIRQRRLRDGMVVLALPDVELKFDDAGRVVDAEPEDSSFTHTIIEMFMVEANEAVARLFDKLNVPMIRRVHPDPDAHDLGDLRQFARVAGYNIPSRPSRKELQSLLDSVRGKPQERAVHLAVLKTLSKAEYAPLLIGHFALASEHYTHFTSPIRRYCDLIIHRSLDAFIDASKKGGNTGGGGGKKKKKLGKDVAADPRVPDHDELVRIGKHCSMTERNSESAERELRTYLVMELMAERLGDDFPGTVTGVTGNGIFVQIDQFLVEGFIPIADLPGDPRDRWRLDKQTGALVAQRSGRNIHIGHTFTVRIAAVNATRRQMELVIIEDPPKTQKPRKKRKQPEGAKKAHEETKKFKGQRKRESRGPSGERQAPSKRKKKKKRR